MDNFLQWVTTNANALSGYVILIIGVVGLLWALSTERLVGGARYKDCTSRLATCKNGKTTP